MHNASTVQVLDPKHDLCDIFLCPVLWKTAEDLDKRGAVSPIQIFHNQIKIVLARECPIQFRNKVTLALPHHDCALSFDIGDLVLGNHIRLAKYLDSKILASELFL